MTIEFSSLEGKPATDGTVGLCVPSLLMAYPWGWCALLEGQTDGTTYIVFNVLPDAAEYRI